MKPTANTVARLLDRLCVIVMWCFSAQTCSHTHTHTQTCVDGLVRWRRPKSVIPPQYLKRHEHKSQSPSILLTDRGAFQSETTLSCTFPFQSNASTSACCSLPSFSIIHSEPHFEGWNRGYFTFVGLKQTHTEMSDRRAPRAYSQGLFSAHCW